MTYCFGDIRVWSRRVLLNFCWISILIDILIANISITVAQTPINYTIFSNSVMRTFRCIYVNCFNNFGFLLSSAQDCKNYTLLGNLRTITQERNMETRQMAPLFSSTFFALKTWLSSLYILEWCSFKQFKSFHRHMKKVKVRFARN